MTKDEAELSAMVLRRLGIDATASQSPVSDVYYAVRVEIPDTAMSWWLEYVEEALGLIHELLCRQEKAAEKEEVSNGIQE